MKSSAKREAGCKRARLDAAVAARGCVLTEKESRRRERESYRQDITVTRRRREKEAGRKPSRAEQIAESDDLTKANIARDLWPLWERDKRRFPWTLPPNERAERFVHAVHEYGTKELAKFVDEQIDEGVAWLRESEERAHRRGEYRATGTADEVPF